MTKETTYLKVEELKPYYLYRIKARNGTVGLWNPNKGEFVLSRYKFGDNYTFGEIHWDLDTSFGTVKPWKELDKSPFTEGDFKWQKIKEEGIRGWYWGNPKEEALLKYLNEWEYKLNDVYPREKPNG